MSGLKRMSKDVLLMEPTALQAFRTTSRLLGSEDGSHHKEQEDKIFKKETNTFNHVHNRKCHLELLNHACEESAGLIFVASSNNHRPLTKRSGTFGFQILKFQKMNFNLFRVNLISKLLNVSALVA